MCPAPPCVHLSACRRGFQGGSSSCSSGSSSWRSPAAVEGAGDAGADHGAAGTAVSGRSAVGRSVAGLVDSAEAAGSVAAALAEAGADLEGLVAAAAAAVARLEVGSARGRGGEAPSSSEKEDKMMMTNKQTVGNRAFLHLSVVALALSLSGCSYNRFTGSEEAIKTQWAQVQNQLQRRNDLIPNLVETAKGFAQQERDVFGAIAASREKLAGARTPEE